MNLTKKTFSGLVWASVERLGVKGVTLLFSIILARLLSPEDYGLVAIPMIVFSLVGCWVDCGISEALIRKQDLREEDLNTAFIISVCCACTCFLLLWIMSPLIANFYHNNFLTSIIRASSIGILLSPLYMVQSVLFTKEVNFKVMAKISVATSLISGILGVCLAMRGLGVWSLIAQSLIGQFLRVVLFRVKCTWRFNIKWSKDSFYYLWNFGYKVTLSRTVSVVFENAYPAIVGLYYSPSVLGNFVKSFSITSLLTQQTTEVVQRVSFPILSQMQSDVDRLSINYRKLLQISVFFMFPLMIGVAVSSKPIVILLLGDQWESMVSILRILSLAMMFYPIHSLSMYLLKVKGKVDVHLMLDVTKGIVGLLLICLAIPYGIESIAECVLIMSVLCLFLNMYFSGKVINLSLLDQIKDIMPILFIASFMGVILIILNYYLTSLVLILFIDVILGILIYISLSYLFMKDFMRQIFSIIQNLKH